MLSPRFSYPPPPALVPHDVYNIRIKGPKSTRSVLVIKVNRERDIKIARHMLAAGLSSSLVSSILQLSPQSLERARTMQSTKALWGPELCAPFPPYAQEAATCQL